MNQEIRPVVGIDLGTRNSCVSIWRNKKQEIITDEFGFRTIPSVLSFYNSVRIAGYNAVCAKDVLPENTIYDLKRLIGRKFNDPDVIKIKEYLTYNIEENPKTGNIDILINKKKYKIEDLYSSIISEIKNQTLQYLKLPPSSELDAIITIPAYFNDSQIQATIDSATIGGINVLKTIKEPTAAALAYGIVNRNEMKGKCIIYDLGAGTLDVSLIDLNGGFFKTLAVSGNSFLGGEDFDISIMNYCIREFRKNNKLNKNIEIEKKSLIKLKKAAETAKKILSYNEITTITVSDFYDKRNLIVKLTRNLMETCCNLQFIQCIKPLDKIFEISKLEKNDIDFVIIVGGSTRMPKIQELILNYFKNTKITSLVNSLNPDEVVSAGASIYGYVCTNQEDPFSENIVLLDVTPLSLGVEELSSQMSIIIPRGSTIPITKTKRYTTDTDNQSSVIIKIFEGESKHTKNNYSVGNFELFGFEKGPSGYPKIDITFSIDNNGILSVSALEKKSKVQNNLIVTSNWCAKGRLSQDEIDHIIKEAKQNENLETIYSVKLVNVYKIEEMCSNILNNFKYGSIKMPKKERKIIEKDVLEILNSIDTNIDELDIKYLEETKKNISIKYATCIYHGTNDNRAYKTINKNQGTTVKDEDDSEYLEKYQKIELNDTADYAELDLMEFKKNIQSVCDDILSIANDSSNHFENEDRDLLVDYIGTVQIWLFSTDEKATIIYSKKMDEINEFCDEILKKYDVNNLFQTKEITLYDKLYALCKTIQESFENQFIDGNAELKNILEKEIQKTFILLEKNKNLDDSMIQKKIDKLNALCDKIYESIYDIDELSIDDDTHQEQIVKITENHDELLNNLGTMLKVDVNKFIK